MSTLTESFSAELKRALADNQVSVTLAAKRLGISRQALYNYLNGKSVPRARILARAMELWGLEVRVGATVFTQESFRKPEKPEPVATQLDLLSQLEAVKQENLQIGVKRVGKFVRISLQIGIPA